MLIKYPPRCINLSNPHHIHQENEGRVQGPPADAQGLTCGSKRTRLGRQVEVYPVPRWSLYGIRCPYLPLSSPSILKPVGSAVAVCRFG